MGKFRDLINKFGFYNFKSDKVITDEISDFITKTNNMPIPSNTFFGLDSNGNNINFGDIRNIINKKEGEWEKELITLLRLRIERILINPTKKIQENKDPFILITMTCIGIETLGEIFHSNNTEKSKPFREIVDKLHKEFPKQLTKGFKEKLSKMWSLNSEIKKIDTLSYLLYRYLRNEMTHNFIAKGVYLSYEATNTFEVIETENEAYIIINPDWYFNRYCEVFNEYFYHKVFHGTKLKDKLIKYMESIINY